MIVVSSDKRKQAWYDVTFSVACLAIGVLFCVFFGGPWLWLVPLQVVAAIFLLTHALRDLKRYRRQEP